MPPCDDSDQMSNERANSGRVASNREAVISGPITNFSALIDLKNQALT